LTRHLEASFHLENTQPIFRILTKWLARLIRQEGECSIISD
jgi:hypothetical protein